MDRKVCFLVGNLNNSGGTERVSTLIANKLESLNYDISILNLTNGENPFFKLNINVKNYSLFNKEISFKKNFLECIYKIRCFIKSNDITHLIVVDSIGCIFTIPALMGLNVKHICWEHFNFKNNNGTFLRDWARRFAVKHCDYVVTLTTDDNTIWKESFKNIKANIVTIPNPNPYEISTSNPLQEHNIVLAVGRLTEQKGYDLLIQSWEQVCKTVPNWKLQIVGSGEDELTLKEQVRSLKIEDRVEFIPTTKDIAIYYQNASVFCLSSRYEGFGMVILEAMAFGLPIVSFDCEVGPRDMVQPGENGLLVPPEDTKKLSDALIDVINLAAEDYVSTSLASKTMAKNFSIEKIIAFWINILK